ncbi:MAG: hypothetical protein H7257_14495 [Taibaiella sp.]|nr:hypothetical protein [Taibaiella sp.]
MKEGKDYIILPDGRLVFTASYLTERGYCCGNGCLNCPFEYINVPEPKRSRLLNNVNRNGHA